jgi:large subunit ribosomal protein L2
MKHHKPTTPGQRGMVSINYSDVLTATRPHKPLTKGRKRSVGRGSSGRVTVQHKGGGHKRAYRDIDFVYDKHNIPARVETVEYDPNRTSFIALVCYKDGERRYHVVPQGVSVGDSVMTASETEVKPGNRMMLKAIPVGTFVFNIELHKGKGAQLVRSAGVFAQVVAHDRGYTHLKLPSTEVRKVSDSLFASIGEVSNPENRLRNLGKAGRSRWLGIRPTVRGSAMNPVDHPHGGGEGRQGIGLRRGPKTRQGKQAYGVKTRKPKKYSNVHRVSRRTTGKRNKAK